MSWKQKGLKQFIVKPLSHRLPTTEATDCCGDCAKSSFFRHVMVEKQKRIDDNRDSDKVTVLAADVVVVRWITIELISSIYRTRGASWSVAWRWWRFLFKWQFCLFSQYGWGRDFKVMKKSLKFSLEIDWVLLLMCLKKIWLYQYECAVFKLWFCNQF